MLINSLQAFLLMKYKTEKYQQGIRKLFQENEKQLLIFADVLIKLVEIKNKLVDIIASDNEIKTFHHRPAERHCGTGGYEANTKERV